MKKKINTKNQNQLFYYYDTDADVFYLSQGKPSKTSETLESENDVLLRLNRKTKNVVGFTILNFTKRLTKPYASVGLPINAQLSVA